jgi:hypothetical protein
MRGGKASVPFFAACSRLERMVSLASGDTEKG